MLQTPTINTEYLTKRLSELGVTEEQNTYTRVWTQPSSSTKDADGKIITTQVEQKREYKIFDADEEGNIIIRYFNLLGQPYRWKKEGTAQVRDYIRKRLRDPKEDMKYYQEAGSGQYPFFNPGIIKKYIEAAATKESKEDLEQATGIKNDEAPGTIETLFVVEGEFKSYKGYLEGLDIVGLPSIHGFYNGDVKGKLHDDIQELIITCRVRKIVFLVDADLLTVKWEEGKDLHKRPASFYASVKAFRESLQLLLDDESTALELCYFMHIQTKYVKENAKGLDDLFCKFPERSADIVKDLLEFNYAKKYFDGMSLLDQNKDVHGRLSRYLGLTDEQEFYKTYKDYIGALEFKFKRRRYVYDNEKREVVFVRHEDADKFMRIGPDWVKLISKLNKYGEKEEEVVSWKFGEIQRDYKKFPDFIDQIMRYDDFCNEPNWNGNYQRVIAGCYNLCEPLKWKATPGPITNTIKFLKHIFQGAGKIKLDENGMYEREEAILGDQFTVALDYFTILMRHPKNMLPVPILVSPENGTGKSTVLKWMQLLFGSNMVILGNEQFKMKFNGHYITKFIIAVDEGFLEVDKKAEKERLKQLVTADSVYLENKGQNVRKINYFGKLIICSNDADRVMKIDDGESRWFVVRVPVIPVEDRDPDLELKLKAEMESFLHFIYNREIFHPRSDRLWFKPEWFITDQFRIIVETTKNRLDRVFEEWIKEQFMMFRLNKIKYSLAHLAKIFNDANNNKYRVDKLELRTYLASKGVVSEKKVQRFKMPDHIDIPEGGLLEERIVFKDVESPTFPFVFEIEQWLSEKEIQAISPLASVDNPVLKPIGSIKSEKPDDLPF